MARDRLQHAMGRCPPAGAAVAAVETRERHSGRAQVAYRGHRTVIHDRDRTKMQIRWLRSLLLYSTSHFLIF